MWRGWIDMGISAVSANKTLFGDEREASAREPSQRPPSKLDQPDHLTRGDQGGDEQGEDGRAADAFAVVERHGENIPSARVGASSRRCAAASALVGSRARHGVSCRPLPPS